MLRTRLSNVKITLRKQIALAFALVLEETDSIVLIITVNSISFYETAICREIFSKCFFTSIFVYFKKILAAHQNAFRKALDSSQKTSVPKSYVSKVAGFYRSNHRIRSVKKVFLERCSQNSQEKACVRDSKF